MTKGLVSTIIPVYNRADMLVDSVTSVLAQTYRPIEIIIIDDGSTDETVLVADELAKAHSDLIKVLHIVHGGPGAAREAGRLQAEGEFIQYLDSDDLLLPEKFELQVRGLREHPECGVSYGKTRYYHIEDEPNDIPLKRTGEKIEWMFPSFLKSRWWSTHTPLFRRSVTDKAGAWESLKNEEDWEYDCRIASMGVKLHYCNVFLSETRDHDVGRLCHSMLTDIEKLADRAAAHSLIFNHAKKADISLDVQEMQHFARELFLLSRQCGATGLAKESRQLFDLARQASLSDKREGLQFRTYHFFSTLLGWETIGKLSVQLDRLRDSLGRSSVE